MEEIYDKLEEFKLQYLNIVCVDSGTHEKSYKRSNFLKRPTM
jgi:hypothetical protein